MATKPFLDEVMHFSIHEDEFKRLPKSIKKAIKSYENVDYSFLLMQEDRAAKFKSLVRDYVIEIKRHKGKESNTECIAITLMLYMLEHMNAREIRKLRLEKLLKK